MKKIVFGLMITILLFPTILFASGNVASIGSNEYSSLSSAVENASNGDTITLFQNTNGSDLTLNSGITLIIPSGVTLTLSGENKAQLGAVVQNNGTIVIDGGVLDASKIESSSTTGLILGQNGLVSIKSDGQLILPSVWHTKWQSSINELWQPNGSYASHIFANTENGASLVINNYNYVYDTNTWKGAFKVGTNNYPTLVAALDSITTEGTIKLLSNTYIEEATSIIDGKKITIDLNGFSLNAINKVLTVLSGELTVSGPGAVIETIPDYAPIYIKGSDHSNIVLNSVINVYGDVTLSGWSGVFITTYEKSGSPYAYGVIITLTDTTIKTYDDTSTPAKKGHGVYINGQIQDTTNAPKIYMYGVTIDSSGDGIYAAGYAQWLIEDSKINGIKSGLSVKSGEFNIVDSTIKATGAFVENVALYNDGINASGAGVQIETNSGYAGKIDMTLENTNISSLHGHAIYEYGSDTNTNVDSLIIKSGKFTATETNRTALKFSKGFTLNKFISNGEFTSDPILFVADGSKVTKDSKSGNYIVNKIVVPTGTYTISGIVTDTEGATIILSQGTNVLKTTETNSSYGYSFSSLAAGVYNLTFIYENQKVIKLVEITDSNIILNVGLPTYNSYLSVYNDKYNVMVGNLDAIATSAQEEVVLSITDVDTNQSASEDAIEEIAKDKDLTFFNLSLLVGDEIVSDVSNSGIIEVVYSYDLKNAKNVVVYRYHNDSAQAFTKLTSKSNATEGSYYLDVENNLIYIYTSKFSVYAIGEDTTENPATSDSIIKYFIIGLTSISSIGAIGFYLNKRKLS